LHSKEEQTFDAKEESKRLELEVKDLLKRVDVSKKECLNLKKNNK
jgi:hypothetical protein